MGSKNDVEGSEWLQVVIYLIGRHHPLDGITNPEYKLLHFVQLTEFWQREEGTSF